ncbi:hypothetical protein XA68_12473 [Ophiocordyceps unilateralis]|uniref:Uncharacterized protein n=1 Tax=Ophiocordyceps unilateralis TaxID=268505 RepID=A0A2A9PCX6_OPHUN|nr:hypothetical protein XA68_12473 [Ophiocordyceps unilateralis]
MAKLHGAALRVCTVTRHVIIQGGTVGPGRRQGDAANARMAHRNTQPLGSAAKGQKGPLQKVTDGAPQRGRYIDAGSQGLRSRLAAAAAAAAKLVDACELGVSSL